MNKQGKRGFTIVELLAILVLLALIATIAGVSISTVRQKVGERQYESLATTIEVAAKKYASEKGVSKLFVQTLINEGLIQADDESKNVYDPRDKNNVLNCHIVTISDGDALLGNENTGCAKELLSDSAIAIKYCAANNPNCEAKILSKDEEKWFNYSLILYPDTTGVIELDLTDATYRWVSPLAPDEVIREKTYQIDSVRVNDQFEVTVTTGGKEYIGQAYVRIDKIAPRVSGLVLTNPENWSPEKEITFKLMDGESGIAGYQITTNKYEVPSTWITEGINNDKEKEIKTTIDFSKYEEFNKGDRIYIWTIDVAGNINGDSENGVDGEGLEINNIDKEAADGGLSLDYSPKYPTYGQSILLEGTVQDNQSGLVSYAFSEERLTKDSPIEAWTAIPGGKTNNQITVNDESQTVKVNDRNYYFCVKDDVNNVDCDEKKIDSLDIEIDSVSIEQTSDKTVHAQNATIGLNASDSKSQINKYCVSTDDKGCNNTWVTLPDPTPSFNLDISIDKNDEYYLCVTDVAGNEDCSNKNPNNGGNGSADVTNIDREGPKRTSGGALTKGNHASSTWTDATGPITIYYAMKQNTTASPSASEYGAAITTTLVSGGRVDGKTYTMSGCGNYYVVWTKAVDALGNETIINQRYDMEPCCSEGTWAYSYCTSNGFIVYRRYNECLSQNQTYTSNDACQTPSSCTSWSSCNSQGWQSRTCSYYYGGNYNSYSDTQPCTYNYGCSSWSTCYNSSQSRTCPYYYGGTYYDGYQTQWCQMCSEGTWTNAGCSSNGYQTQSRYNGCLGRTETRTSGGCTTSTTCSAWSSCSGGSRSRTCGYYYNGNYYSAGTQTDTSGCAPTTTTSCGSYGSCAVESGFGCAKRRTCYVYTNGVQTSSYSDRASCSSCSSPPTTTTSCGSYGSCVRESSGCKKRRTCTVYTNGVKTSSYSDAASCTCSSGGSSGGGITGICKCQRWDGSKNVYSISNCSSSIRNTSQCQTHCGNGWNAGWHYYSDTCRGG